MAICNITEYQYLADVKGNSAQCGFHDGNETVTNKTYNAATDHILQSTTNFIRLKPDTLLYWTLGGTATTTNGVKMLADESEVFGVKPGSTISLYDGTT